MALPNPGCIYKSFIICDRNTTGAMVSDLQNYYLHTLENRLFRKQIPYLKNPSNISRDGDSRISGNYPAVRSLLPTALFMLFFMLITSSEPKTGY